MSARRNLTNFQIFFIPNVLLTPNSKISQASSPSTVTLASMKNTIFLSDFYYCWNNTNTVFISMHHCWNLLFSHPSVPVK